MLDENTAMPWEERKIYRSDPGKNRAISVERFERLKKLIQFNYEGFWDEIARDIEWFKTWGKTIEGGVSESPEFRFFTGGYSNVCYNMLDRHLKVGADNRSALIWESESGDKVEYYTYGMLYHEVCRFSNALRNLGVKKGDRIAVFLPNSPAVAVAILSAYRLGLVFAPLFTGLSIDTLRARLNNFEAKIIVTMDGTYRKGKVLPLKSIMDETLKGVESVKTVIVKKYAENEVVMLPERDQWWDEITAGTSGECPPTLVEANEIQTVIYTSGTSGKPKGAAIAGLGIAVQTALGGKIESALIENDVFYSLNDNAWAGSEFHAILPVWLNGATLVWQEGAAFAIPNLERFYRTIERYRVNKVHLAPTVLRLLKAQGEEMISKYDLSGLELMLCMGEPLSPDLWKWAVNQIGKGQMYLNNVGDMTELGGCIIQPAAFISPMKPGAMGRIDSLMGGPALGVFDDEGNELPVNSRGNMVFKKPVPGASRTLWKEHDRYVKDYIRSYRGSWCWLVQDEGVIDEDGYFWVLGRIDDVINVAGHRLSTSELEGAIAGCREVEAAAVVGIPDPIKEQIPTGFIKLREGIPETDELKGKINDEVIRSLGRFAKLEEIIFVKQMPTTISGKIMRRVLRDLRVHGKIAGDITTLEDTGSIDLIRKAMSSRSPHKRD